MTLKTRNQMNIFLLGFFSFMLIVQLSLLIIFFINGTLDFSSFIDFSAKGAFLLKKQNLFIVLGIFFQFMFVIINAWVTHRSFVKTQAFEVPFYLLFLVAIFFDTFRIVILTFNLSPTFSDLYIRCGNLCLLSRILSPLSILLMTCLPYSNQKQNSDSISFVCILASIFISSIIPLNTAKTLSNFSVDYNFKILVLVFSVCSYLVSIITLYFTNKNNGYNQLTTIGLGLLILGSYSIKYTLNFILLIIALIELTIGTILFVKQLHNHYLWRD